MKKILYIIPVFISFSLFFGVKGQALDVYAKSAILVEKESGNVIYAKNPDEKAGMASTTKIMTSLLAIENGKLDSVITATKDTVGVEGTSVYLKEGEKLTLKQLLYCVMLQSANDAAETVACGVCGSKQAFVDLMNKKAEELELDSTHFSNPHGLSDENHYTTARDLANLTRYALQNETFSKIVSSKSYVIPGDEDNSARTLSNHNKLLRFYEGCNGVKTGFTKATGRCLVSSAQRNGVSLVCVTLNDGNDWNDHIKMLDYGFSQYESITLAEKDGFYFELPVLNGQRSSVIVKNEDGLVVPLKKTDEKISSKIILPHFCFAPVEKGEELGYVVFYSGKDEIGRVSLKSQNTVSQTERKKSFFEKALDGIWKK